MINVIPILKGRPAYVWHAEGVCHIVYAAHHEILDPEDWWEFGGNFHRLEDEICHRLKKWTNITVTEDLATWVVGQGPLQDCLKTLLYVYGAPPSEVLPVNWQYHPHPEEPRWIDWSEDAMDIIKGIVRDHRTIPKSMRGDPKVMWKIAKKAASSVGAFGSEILWIDYNPPPLLISQVMDNVMLHVGIVAPYLKHHAPLWWVRSLCHYHDHKDTHLSTRGGRDQQQAPVHRIRTNDPEELARVIASAVEEGVALKEQTYG
jgi:hypothetical protein